MSKTVNLEDVIELLHYEMTVATPEYLYNLDKLIDKIKSLPSESKEIPMSEILDIPRQIAIAFADTYIDMRDTVKLASDIQNFAIQYAESKNEWIGVTVEAKENVWYQCAMLTAKGDYDILLMAYQYYKLSGWIAYGEPSQDERVTHYKALPSPPTK